MLLLVRLSLMLRRCQDILFLWFYISLIFRFFRWMTIYNRTSSHNFCSFNLATDNWQMSWFKFLFLWQRFSSLKNIKYILTSVWLKNFSNPVLWRNSACSVACPSCRLRSGSELLCCWLKIVKSLSYNIVHFIWRAWSVLVIIAVKKMPWQISRSERSSWLVQRSSCAINCFSD